MSNPPAICVAGGGSWGTALAHHCAGLGHDVALWLRDEAAARHINDKHENPRYLRGFPLHEKLAATTDVKALGREIVICAVPCQQLRGWLGAHKSRFVPGVALVNAAKGIETQTRALGHAVVADVDRTIRYVALSGPSFAAEVARGQPTAVVLAGSDEALVRRLQEIFSAAAFRCYASADVIGVEMGGALKNVMAIAAGLCDGLELGLNSRAALITRGLAEMSRVGVACGAKEHTFMGLSGLGDLVLTCTGQLSRNRQAGLRLARGESADAIAADLGMVVEGIKTTLAAFALARELGQETPIIDAVYNIIQNRLDPRKEVTRLMGRTLKNERMSAPDGA
ncbi:MAG: NAD(P)-dependent glycerol-3-phosphate dehydrogenase [Desulfovibrio sp.]|jgi:glycerol-3-phosphate dehydrogenase (NAD(P)+)|nr:NAD(P)-dependent glycerol-3-phosphate dehydrogenase [Desulfovibrio sp.]